jgi:DNA mismatch repair protein MSH5
VHATSCQISFRPNVEFAYESARNKLISIKVGHAEGSRLILQTPDDTDGVPAEQQRQGNLLRLASYIQIDSRVTVGCAGAVLAYLQRRQVSGESVVVAAIEMWSMADAM